MCKEYDFFQFFGANLAFFSIRASEQFTQKRSQPQIAWVPLRDLVSTLVLAWLTRLLPLLGVLGLRVLRGLSCN